MTEIAIAFVLVFLTGVLAGWRCCLAWQKRRQIRPTPMQRALCASQMAEHREKMSMATDEAFWCGIHLGQNLKKP